MIERIKMFEQKNKQRNSKNLIETPVKMENKKYIPKSTSTEKLKGDNKNDILEADDNRKNKFLENSDNNNSYVRQSIKRNSFLKNKNNNEIPLFFNIIKKNKKTNNNKSVDNNIIYKNFINNIKKGIDNNNQIENKKLKNHKKKNILGNFLNKFVNKEQINKQDELKDKNILIINNEQKFNTNKNNHFFMNINKIRKISFFIESNKNINNEINKMKKELELKDNKIKDLLKNIEKYNNLVQENEKLKKEIIQYKNIINHMNPISDKNNKNTSNLEQNNNNSKSISIKNNKFNNLITYNINKNNNYNIITGQINNFDNLNINNQNNKEKDKEIIKKENVVKNSEEPTTEKEKEKEKESNINDERAKKATRAFQRFKRANKSIDLSSTNKGNALKSDNIMVIAKMLEGHLGNKDNNNNKINREKSVEVSHKVDDSNEIIDIINNQPVVNKKKKNIKSFSLDE